MPLTFVVNHQYTKDLKSKVLSIFQKDNFSMHLCMLIPQVTFKCKKLFKFDVIVPCNFRPFSSRSEWRTEVLWVKYSISENNFSFILHSL